MASQPPAPALPPARQRKLQRDTRRRWLGGVCAGLAHYLGSRPGLIRLLFALSIPMTGTISFWVYLLLWAVLRPAAVVEMPKLKSYELNRCLRRIDRQVTDLHRRLPASAAELANEAFDALKLLAPYLDRSDAPAIPTESREAGLARLPKCLDQLLRLRGTQNWDDGPAQALLGELADIRERLRREASAAITREFGGHARPHLANSPEMRAWQETLAPRRDRLALSAGSATLATLGAIEEKLGFLLERVPEGDQTLDLRPYEVRKIAFNYLPDALDQYLALPASMARSQVLGSGKTAEEALNDQLGLLDKALYDLAQSLFEKDATNLVVHGRFLKEKFAEQPFRLPQ